MLTMRELAEMSHNTAVEKGWYEMKDGAPQLRDKISVICLLHSEVSEILEAYRDSSHDPGDVWFSNTGEAAGKPEGLIVEIADLFLRVADTAQIENGFDPDFSSRVCGKLSHASVLNEQDLFYEQKFHELFGFVMGEGHPSIENMIFASHKILSRYDRFSSAAITGYWLNLQFLLLIWSHFCWSQGWDLESVIRVKMAYNSTRPIRHGNKRL